MWNGNRDERTEVPKPGSGVDNAVAAEFEKEEYQLIKPEF